MAGDLTKTCSKNLWVKGRGDSLGCARSPAINNRPISGTKLECSEHLKSLRVGGILKFEQVEF